MLAEKGMLNDMINQVAQPKKKAAAIAAPVQPTVTKSKKRAAEVKTKTKKYKKKK